MMGLAHLVETRLGKPTRLTRDGVISRAENRAMVQLLDIELCPIDKLTWDGPNDAVVMVDSQPNTGRHTTTRPATSTASRSSMSAAPSARPARW
jgi:hypothetical protein